VQQFVFQYAVRACEVMFGRYTLSFSGSTIPSRARPVALKLHPKQPELV